MRWVAVWMVFASACGGTSAPNSSEVRSPEPAEPAAPAAEAPSGPPRCGPGEHPVFVCALGSSDGVAVCTAGEGEATRIIARIDAPGESAASCVQERETDACSIRIYQLVQPAFGTREGLEFTAGGSTYFVFDEEVEDSSSRGVRRRDPEQEWECVGEVEGSPLRLEGEVEPRHEYPY